MEGSWLRMPNSAADSDEFIVRIYYNIFGIDRIVFQMGVHGIRITAKIETKAEPIVGHVLPRTARGIPSGAT